MYGALPLCVVMALPNTRRNAVRFELSDDLEMDRLFFSRHILQKELGITTNQLDYLFAFPGKKVFEVVFRTLTTFKQCLKDFESKKASPAFRKISMCPLADEDRKTVHVLILTERVR